jgi:superfamily II DNA or RNA helicase
LNLQLRPYQETIVSDLRRAYREGSRAVLLASPTGSGKTAVFAYITEGAARRGNRVMILVHRQELLSQCSGALTDLGVPHGMIAPNRTMTYDPVQVASVQTLVRRLQKTPAPNLIIVDEAHHAAAGSWRRIIEHYRKSLILGVTATPVRLDGQGLGVETGGYFDRMVLGPSVRELIEQGYLSRPVVYAPPVGADLAGVHRRFGDFVAKETAERMDKPHITGNAVDHYLRICPNAPAIAFCSSVKHAEHMAERFRDAGIPSESLDGTLDDRMRRHRIMALADGRIRVLTSCDIVSEGTDIPVVTAAILLRPTQSTGLYLQQCLDDKTEILTKEGWKGRSDIKKSDMVAAFDTKDSSVSWRDILSITDRPLSPGETMYGIKAPHLNLRVTAGHDMVVRSRSTSSKNWIKQTAEAAARRSTLFTIPVSGNINIEDCENITDEEIRFVGWYLTDGTKNKKTNAISISQSAGKPMHCGEIRRVLSACGFKYGECRVKRTGEYSKYEDNIMFTVSYGIPRGRDKHLRGWSLLSPWMDKSIGPVFDSLSARQLGILLSAMNLGDGANQRKTISWNYHTMSIAFGTNEHMADRIQELCVLRGFRANKTVYQAHGRGPWWTLYIKPATYATLPGRNVAGGSISGKKRYNRSRLAEMPSREDEMVWCVENDLGTLITRRDGKVAIVGNCGRVLRPFPGKTNSIILDHVGNVFRHGFPDQDRVWTLDGEDVEKRPTVAGETVSNVQCEQCYLVFPAWLKQCPACGWERENGREVREVDGELEKLEAQMQEKFERKREISAARSLDELIAVGKRLGYKPGWANYVWRARCARQSQRAAI